MAQRQEMEQNHTQVTTTRRTMDVGKYALELTIKVEHWRLLRDPNHPELNFDKSTLEVHATSDASATFSHTTLSGNIIKGSITEGPHVGDSTIEVEIPERELKKKAWEKFYDEYFLKPILEDGRPNPDEEGDTEWQKEADKKSEGSQ